jgi:hypothetical protein
MNNYKKKYIKYKNKYLQLKQWKIQKGGINITFEDLITPVFLQYIQEQTKEYFRNKKKEYGGIITFSSDNKYEIVKSEYNDSVSIRNA